MSIKITKLEIENVKRVRACTFNPKQNGLTVIGGKNGQGKTSILDAIVWALGGNKFKPSSPQNKESVLPPTLHVELSNGLVVERKGKNSELKVIDPNGKKSGQNLLDSFIEELALNLPKFMNSNNKEKANTLLQILGIGEKLAAFERKENELYQERLYKGRELEAKRGYLKEMPYFNDVPSEPVSASELIKRQQDILARNGENQRKRLRSSQIDNELQLKRQQLAELEQKVLLLETEISSLEQDSEIAHKDILDLIDESTEELENSLAEIERINQKVSLNQKHDNAEVEVKRLTDEYNTLTTQINDVRNDKISLLDGANLPLPGLSIEDQELTYNGQKWDNMSASEQLRVATAIVRKLKPECGFVLIDKLEQMDMETLNDFGLWLESEGLQAIATRVSTGEECEIIINDGVVVANHLNEEKEPAKAGWGGSWK